MRDISTEFLYKQRKIYDDSMIYSIKIFDRKIGFINLTNIFNSYR